MSSDLIQYTGRCTYTKFRSDDNSYCVCIYTDTAGNDTTVVGNNLPNVKYPVTLLGQYIKDPKYGLQFKAEVVLDPLPEESQDIIDFLVSLKIGIGKKRAKQMVKLAGAKQFWKTLESSPDSFTEVNGVSSDTIKKLKLATSDMRLRTDLLKLFEGKLTMNSSQFNAIRKAFFHELDSVVQRISDNPYCLMAAGYTFQELDDYAAQLPGYEPTCPERIQAGLEQVLIDAERNAHAGLPLNMAAAELQTILNKRGKAFDYNRCYQIVEKPPHNWKVISSRDYGLIYRKESYDQETCIANKLTEFASQKPKSVSAQLLEQKIQEYEEIKGFQLDNQQKKAIQSVFFERVVVITGGPGTGKSTILDAILYCWKEICRNTDWILLAPTGRASKRMRETTGQAAFTIHSAIAIQVDENDNGGSTTCNAGEVLKQTLIVVDEMSMVDQATMAALVSVITCKDSRLVLVGDPDQLPSVRAGNVLGDIIDSGAIPVNQLSTIFRQAAENPIVTNAVRIQNGITELMWTQSFKRGYSPTTEETINQFCRFYKKCVNAYGIDQVILLTPYRDRKYAISTQALNPMLQDAINPDIGQPKCKKGIQTFRLNDRVMQMRNNYDIPWHSCDDPDIGDGAGVFNGDIGTITAIDVLNETLDVYFDGFTVQYSFGQLNELELAYCQTVHKSQGSQYRVVLMLMPEKASSFLRRNMFYTGITRAVEYVAIGGSLQVIAQCIRNDSTDTRYTRLADRLADAS